MFTGIIEDIGTVKEIRETKIKIITCLPGIKQGDSISVNGGCLTVSKTPQKSNNNPSPLVEEGRVRGRLKTIVFEADVSLETFSITNFKYLKPGSKVNLERSLPADGRFGGHFVTGHVEATGKLISIKKHKNLQLFTFETKNLPIVNKGSVAIDGISLTPIINKPSPCNRKKGRFWFSVASIPQTLKQTTLGSKKVGDIVNIEPDILAKYQLQKPPEQKSGITQEKLKNAGFL